MSGRRLTRLPLFASVAALVLSALAPAQATPPAQEQFVNTEHVFNFPVQEATDIEFFTSTVPLRNYTTGALILDGNGQPIPSVRDFAVMGVQGGLPAAGAYVFDITNPEQPQFVRQIPCAQEQNDVQLKRFGDRWILALAADITMTCVRLNSPRGTGVSFFDVTDPYAFSAVSNIAYIDGSHNFTFHPTKPYAMISSGDLPGGRDFLPVVDLTNLSAPRIATTLPSVGGPHDIAFSTDGDRAYVASENNVRIYDTTDPANPVPASVTVAPTSYVHDATPSPDGTRLVVTGESLVLGGFFTPGGLCPGEGLTVYDISNPAGAPVLVSEFIASVEGPVAAGSACTAHVGKWTTNGRYYVMGWYSGGVRVVDLSDPVNPVEAGIAMLPTQYVWAAKSYKGPYIYASDSVRGFDVFRWTGPSFE
jgi:hypothetical protein